MSESGGEGLTGDLGIVARLGFHGWDIADGIEKAPVVEPVDPFNGRELDRFEAAPGAAPMDHLGFVEAVDGLGEGVVVAVPDSQVIRSELELASARLLASVSCQCPVCSCLRGRLATRPYFKNACH